MATKSKGRTAPKVQIAITFSGDVTDVAELVKVIVDAESVNKIAISAVKLTTTTAEAMAECSVIDKILFGDGE